MGNNHHLSGSSDTHAPTIFPGERVDIPYVWGIEIGGDAVCWTDDFVVAQGNIVNATVGGTAVVVAWDPIYESLGAYYNTTGAPVQSADFFGKTDSGETLPRVETLRPGMFWHVWAEFFPQTEINRVDEKASGDKGAGSVGLN